MSKARDIANILSANTSMATDAEVTAALSTAVTNERSASATLTNKTIDGNLNTIHVKRGTTLERPLSGTVGDQYYNTDEEILYNYKSTGWVKVSQDPAPLIASISPTVAPVTNTLITITGSDFKVGATVQFVGSNGTFNSPTVTFISSNSITATTPQLLVSGEPYTVKLTNPDNQYSTLSNALDAGSSPTWTTAAGSLGEVGEGLSASFSVLAVDPDGSAITYSSSDKPAWLSLNSSTGSLNGTAPSVSSDTTYSFSVSASDGINSTSRSFSITVKDLVLVTSGLIMHLDASNSSSYSGSGSTWYDLSGNSKNVSLSGTSFSSNDGGGISFNGTSSYGTFNSSGFTTSYTIEAMVKLTQYNSDGSSSSDIMMLTNSSGTHGLLLEVDAGPRWRNVHRYPYGTSPDDELTTANGTVSDNTKYHIMVVRDGSSSQKLYVNGTLVASKTPILGGFDTNLTAGTLGRLNQTNAARHWYGLMHQIRIYNRALSSTEVTQNFNYTRGKFGI